MLINVSQGEECRIALVEDKRLEELYMERTSSTSHVGNIYKGRVTNVEPSIQAAFIDFGLGRNGFLHISDLMPSYFGGSNGDFQESVGRKVSRRDRPPIQRCLRRGDEIIVQIIKEGIGTKGPTLTTYLSIPGRILVMMPGMAKMGISRKIEDEEERRKLRQILDSLKPPKDVGFIIRTSGVGATKTEIQRDLTYLTRLWTNFVKKRDSGPGPTELYTEGDLVTRTVRDVFTSDIDTIVVDDKEVAKRVKEVIKLANPRAKNKVELYEGAVPLFHKYGIEREIELMYSRHVPLPSGGSLVIDSTEAIVAIDVNSGKFREHADAETTAFRTDMEAADEIPRQLRLRDLGGVIICDFIDLRFERHRRELFNRLLDNFAKDRAKTKVLPMSQFGIIELTRQRMRPSLKRSIYFDCPHCRGAGLVKTPESMSLDVMRRLAIAMNDLKVARVEVTVCPDVAFYLENKKRRSIVQLETQFNKRVVVRSDAAIPLDDARLELFDSRDVHVYLEELGMAPPAPLHPPQRQGRGDRGRSEGGGRRDDRRDRRDQGRDRDRSGRDQRDRGRRDQRPRRDQPHAAEEREAEDEIDIVEEELDRREEALAEPEGTGEPAALPPPAETEVAEVVEAEIVEEVPARGGGKEEQPVDDGRPEPGNELYPPDRGNRGHRDNQGKRHRDDRNRDDRDRGGRGGRRRGRRGRGGRGQNQQQYENQNQSRGNNPPARDYVPAADDEAEMLQPPPEFQNEVAEAAPVREDDQRSGRRRRGRRGGRGRRRGPGSEQSPGQPNSQSQPSNEPPRDEPRAREAPNVNPTGSADRHLAHDEPIEPPRASRPRSHRDLDSIPDDYD
jgi:ribonuclease E